jgi:surface carbohydrate biosynthesis protein
MFLNLKNFFQVIKVLLKTKYIFKKPKTKKIIIFDNKGANTPYYKLFENNDCEILNVQGETLNIYVALLVLLNLKALS